MIILLLRDIRISYSETKQCLLPLANTPLIEYTLEFLANAGVEEVFLYGGAHTDQVEEYIKFVY
jgi:translation initiation factor eIF-2B subunit epsilon